MDGEHPALLVLSDQLVEVLGVMYRHLFKLYVFGCTDSSSPARSLNYWGFLVKMLRC